MTAWRLFAFTLTCLLSVPVAAAAGGQEPTSPAPAQAPPVGASDAPARPLIQAGLGLMMGVPVGDFHENVEFSAGLSGHFDFALGHSPISLGVEGTYLWYGSESRDVPLVGMPDLAVGVNTSNDMFLLHGRVRAQRQTGRVRPYVDGLVGLNYLATTTTVDAEETCFYNGFSYTCTDDGDSTTNLDDVVLSAGGGAGVQFAFGESPHSMRLDVSLRYLYGGEAVYLTEGDIHWPMDGPVILEARRSRTDLLMVYIGLTWGR
jgi:hypothetical protein